MSNSVMVHQDALSNSARRHQSLAWLLSLVSLVATTDARASGVPNALQNQATNQRADDGASTSNPVPIGTVGPKLEPVNTGRRQIPVGSLRPSVMPVWVNPVVGNGVPAHRALPHKPNVIIMDEPTTHHRSARLRVQSRSSSDRLMRRSTPHSTVRGRWQHHSPETPAAAHRNTRFLFDSYRRIATGKYGLGPGLRLVPAFGGMDRTSLRPRFSRSATPSQNNSTFRFGLGR